MASLQLNKPWEKPVAALVRVNISLLVSFAIVTISLKDLCLHLQSTFNCNRSGSANSATLEYETTTQKSTKVRAKNQLYAQLIEYTSIL